MDPTRPIIASRSTRASEEQKPWSGWPSENATPALVVAIAEKPAAASILALPTSQAFGIKKQPSEVCRSRNLRAFSSCVICITFPPPSRQAAQDCRSMGTEPLLVLIHQRWRTCTRDFVIPAKAILFQPFFARGWSKSLDTGGIIKTWLDYS